MNRSTFKHHPADRTLSPGFPGRAIYHFLERGREPIARFRAEKTIAFGTAKISHIRFAQAGSRFHDRIEHPLQIEGRATNDFEHVCGSGLLLQRLPQLIEQPRVLNGDDGLRGEGLHKRDLLIGERFGLQPVDGDGTY